MKTGKCTRCAICGLRIPLDIVSSKHPLFPTIDHIVPLSHGGTNSAKNRRPAHFLCNQRKADRIVLTHGFVAALRDRIVAELSRRGVNPGFREAARYVTVPVLESKRQSRNHFHRYIVSGLSQWEDDGGRIAEHGEECSR